LGAHGQAGNRDQAPMIESRNIGRTVGNFQCRARIINGLFCAISILSADVSRWTRNCAKENASVPVCGTEAQVSAGKLKAFI
jgi:hypothetical protein